MLTRIYKFLVVVTISIVLFFSLTGVAAAMYETNSADEVAYVISTTIKENDTTIRNKGTLMDCSEAIDNLVIETISTEILPNVAEETVETTEGTEPIETENAIVETIPEEVEIIDLGEENYDKIIERVEYEDGTKVFQFCDRLYIAPSIPVNNEAKVAENGYVEKITSVPHYFQQSYRDVRYGNYGTVASHGCGVASIAMVYSYLLDREILPDEIAERYGRFNTEHGSCWNIFPTSAEDYGLTIEYSQPNVAGTFKWETVVEALKAGKVVIANAKQNIFTQGGHFIVLYGITEDGKILVKDPNVYNYGQWSNKILKDGFENGFDEKYIKYSNFPCWIYSAKDIEVISAREAIVAES